MEQTLSRHEHDLLLARFRREQIRNHQRTRLYDFIWGAFNVLHEDRGILFKPTFHIEAIAYRLGLAQERILRRLLINIAPRHLKTICCSVAFPAFVLGHNPAAKFIIACYARELTVEIQGKLRQLMESDWYRQLFPAVQFEVSGSTLRTSRGGSVRFTSVGGSITGFGADYIVMDDIMKANEYASQAMRDEAWDFVRGALLSRFDDQSKGVVIAVQQRLHQDDVAARMIGTGTYFHLNLPAIAQKNERIQIGPNRFHDWKAGEALFPTSQPLEVLEQIRKDQTDVFFSAQYLQDPTPLGGNRLNFGVFGTYDEAPPLDEMTQIVQSWDTAESESARADFTVCQTWGRYEGDWYLLDLLRDKMEFAKLLQIAVAHRRRWKADRVLIEFKGTGRTLFTQLTREHEMSQFLIRVDPVNSKLLRFDANLHRLERETFYLPDEARWLDAFRSELLAFPNGRNDDQVDSFSQFLAHLGTRNYLMSKDRLKF